MEYCRTIKQRMTTLPLTIDAFDLVIHQWKLDQFEMFETIQETECMGEYKMAPTDFVELITGKLKVFMPEFIQVYRNDDLKGDTWSVATLKTRLETLAAKGTRDQDWTGSRSEDNESDGIRRE